MVICSGDVQFMSNLATGNGRPDHVARGIARPVAREHLRLMARRFHGYGMPTFAGKAIYAMRATGFRRVRTLPIVSRYATVTLDRV